MNGGAKQPYLGTMGSSLELIEAAQAGDGSALEHLAGLYRPHLRRWARGRLPRGARAFIDTEDVVQEVLAASVQKVQGFQYRHAGAFQAYLREAVRNRIRDEIRKAERGPLAKTLEERAAPYGSPLDELVGREALSRYEQALERLKPQEREAVVSRIELGMSYAEVAESIGKPSADAARMTVARALVKLIEEMSNARKTR